MAECYERIKEAMGIRGKTQAELCDMTGIPKSAMSQYVSGKFIPKQTRIYLLAKALNVSEAWLMGYDVSMDREVITLDYSYIDETKEYCKKHFPKHSKDVECILNDLDCLNDKGISEVCKRVHELTMISEYSNLCLPDPDEMNE